LPYLQWNLLMMIRQALIDKEDVVLMAWQCVLTGVLYASVCQEGTGRIDGNELLFSLLTDDVCNGICFTATVRRWSCTKAAGHTVNHKRVQDLMRKMGWQV
jgi:hypothetical protein